MAKAAPTPCRHPGCAALVFDGTGYCLRHERKAWAEPTAGGTKRTRGRKLQQMRQRLFAVQPLCEECERRGIVRAATQRDHRIPLCDGGADDASNEQALCDECHDVKSKAERKRGLRPPGG